MKKIKMKKDKEGSENGTIVKKFNKGQIYVIANPLAEVFLKEKWAIDLDTPEALEKDRKKAVNLLGMELSELVRGCFEPALDSVQLTKKIEELEAYPVNEDGFQERFEDAEKIKAVGLKDAKESLKVLNEANAKKGE